MDREYVDIFVYLDMPNGETPTIDSGDKASAKIETAITEVLEAGATTYGFTVSEMSVGEDTTIGIVLTHEDA